MESAASRIVSSMDRYSPIQHGFGSRAVEFHGTRALRQDVLVAEQFLHEQKGIAFFHSAPRIPIVVDKDMVYRGVIGHDRSNGRNVNESSNRAGMLLEGR